MRTNLKLRGSDREKARAQHGLSVSTNGRPRHQCVSIISQKEKHLVALPTGARSDQHAVYLK